MTSDQQLVGWMIAAVFVVGSLFLFLGLRSWWIYRTKIDPLKYPSDFESEQELVSRDEMRFSLRRDK